MQLPPFAVFPPKTAPPTPNHLFTSTSPPLSLPLQSCPKRSWRSTVGFFGVSSCTARAYFVAAKSESSLDAERNPVFFFQVFKLVLGSSFSVHLLTLFRPALTIIASIALEHRHDLARFMIA